MKGKITLPMLWGSEYSVFGGRYIDKPSTMYGVKMAAEIKAACDVDIPTRDYSVPSMELMTDGLRKGIKLIATGKPVYAGCMGGIGRTGLYLAILAKAWGIKDPVKYVREHYFNHAVETKEQMEYIANFEIPKDVRWELHKMRVKNALKVKKSLTII